MPHKLENSNQLSFDRLLIDERIRPAGNSMPLFATLRPARSGPPARAGRRALQAFDAADEYLLNQLHERGVTAQCRVLVSTTPGALAASLAPHVQVTSSGDSHLGFLSLRKNPARTAWTCLVRFVPASGESAAGPFDHVLVKVLKTLRLRSN